MDLSSPRVRRRMMTPSGVPTLDYRWGAPRPPGPTQNLIPVGRGSIPTPGRATPVPPDNSLEALPIALPKLDSSLIQATGQPQIPWQYLFINLWRLAQPTGVTPGTNSGITVNAHGQVINTEASGAQIDSPNLTGSPTSVTPPANDNSNAIATTAWVAEQNFLPQSSPITLTGDASGAGLFGGVPTTVVALQHRAVSAAAPAVGQALIWNGVAWAPGQAGIPDAPADGQRYVRQNGQWVVIVSP